MNFHDTVAPLIYNPDKRPLHGYMRAGGLLANNVDCQHCQQPMELVDRPDDQEKFSWRCSNGRCARKHSRMSVKTGSIFEKTKVPLDKWLHVVVLWTIETSVTNTCALTSMSMHTVIDLFQFLRDICGGKLLQNPVQLGGIDATGAGIICEIDESCFRHKTKYHRGRAPQRNQWVFGIVDTSTTPATGYLRMVNRRDAATLLPIIQNVIRPGSIIHSDQWRAYHGIQQQLGLQHRTVNHSLNFVDPGTGVHTQHIELYWNKCKGRFNAMHGTTIGKLPSYLDEFMWRDRFGRTHQDCFDNIQRHIAEFYPV